MAAAACLLSLGLSRLLGLAGWDIRGTFVGTYVQRNALIVGFAMGFAVIPIIYTIAEDALNAVPEHLRAASLACGATQWQTIRNIVLPKAMPGIMTGLILAMARGAGEVAPLMLVGVVKLAPRGVGSRRC